jgi:hypothetical protein
LTDVNYAGSEISWDTISISNGNDPLYSATIHFGKESDVLPSGTCGDNLTWALDAEGTLTISGTGSMDSYSGWTSDDGTCKSGSPWFAYRRRISSVVIEEGVSRIGNLAFAGCGNLTSVKIPDSVTYIGGSAFFSCSSLTDVYYSGSESKWGAFYIADGNTPLYSANIHYGKANTEVLYSGTCGENLTWTLNGNGLLTISGTGDMENYSWFKDVPWTQYCSEIVSIVIGDGVTSIGDYAFYSCSNLTCVSLPDSIISIGSAAFAFCSSLPSIEIPDGVTSIGREAFIYCSSLTNINIPDSMTNIGELAFYNCNSLTRFSVASNNPNYSDIDGVLFNKDQTTLIQYPANRSGESCSIPDSVTSIGSGAFTYCKNLVSVEIPDSVTSVGEDVFYGCEKLAKVTLSNAMTSIGYGMFGACSSLPEVIIPDSVTFIDGYAFSGCSSLENVIFGKSVTSIGEGAFYGCSALPDITIPSSVVSIGDSAFARCTGLTSVTILGSIVDINSYTFFRCDHLASITIPRSVAKIGEYAFYYCDSLADVYYTGSEEDWESIDIGSCNNPITSATIHFNEKDSNEEDSEGSIQFTVIDTETQEPISGAKLYVVGEKLEDGSQVDVQLSSNSKGVVKAELPDGTYSIQAAASGYQLRSFHIEVTADNRAFTVPMNNRDILQIETSVKEMTLEEIKNAGIDVDASDNNHYYQCTAVLDFVPVPAFNYVCDESGKVISGGEPVRVDESTIIYPVARDVYLIVPSEISWLKEMFDVQLIVTNSSSIEQVKDTVATLELPSGLSLVTMVSDDAAESLTVNLGDIAPKGQQSAHWYLRGDEKGEYTLNGTVTGTRVYEGISEDINYSFTTKDPITVLAGDAMKLTIEAERYAKVGTPYRMRYTLENVSSKDLYNVSLNVLGGKFLKEYNASDLQCTPSDPDAATLSGSFNNGYALTAETLKSGDKLTGIFTITFGEGVDLEFTDYILKDAFTVTGNGSTTEVPTEIIIVDSLDESHTWDSGTILQQPTCTEAGQIKYTCTDCGKTKTEEIAPLGHDYVETVTDPTCTEQGYTTHTCSRGDYSYTDNITEALGHDYTVEVIEPTCTEQGCTKYTCTRCDDSYTDNVTEALGHNYKVEVVEPTCTEQGYTKYTCTRCDDSYMDNEIPALGHTWNDGVVTKEPTVTEEGVKTYTCTVCGATKTEVIAKLLEPEQEQEVEFFPGDMTQKYGNFHTIYNAAENYSEGGGELTYASSDQTVATVNQEGTVTVIGAGETTITATAAAVPGKYLETTASYKLTVTKAQLTVTVQNTSIVYGAEAANTGYTVEGLVWSDTAEQALSGTGTYSYGTYQPGSAVGEYPITLSDLTSQNYEITYVPGTLTVTKAALTVTAQNAEIFRGEEAKNNGYTVSGLVSGDTAEQVLSGTAVYSYGDYQKDSAEGEYPITLTGLTADNYEITFIPGVLTVKAPILNFIGSKDGEKIPVDVTIQEDGTISVDMESEDIDKVIENAGANDGKVTVNLKDSQVPEDSGKISISGELFTKAQESDKVSTVTISAKAAEITMSEGVLDTVAKELQPKDENGTTKLNVALEVLDQDELNDAQKAALSAITKDAVVLDLKMFVDYLDSNGNTTDTKELHQLGGTVTVRTAFTLPADMTNRRIVVTYVSEDGTVTYQSATYADGFITFTTNHFSLYVIDTEEITGNGNYKVNYETGTLPAHMSGMTAPQSVTVTDGKFTPEAATYVYTAGNWYYTFGYWTDAEDHKYEVGTEYDIKADLTLTPVWELYSMNGDTTWNIDDALVLMQYVQDSVHNALTTEQLALAKKVTNKESNFNIDSALTIMQKIQNRELTSQTVPYGSVVGESSGKN